MAIVVVGGQARKIGKTSVVAGIITAMPQYNWTAFKITQKDHGAGPASGGPRYGCAVAPCAFVMEEHSAASGKDSSRYLQAGAVRSFFVRAPQGGLAGAIPRIREELAGAENAILESNSVLRFLDPDLYLMVLDSHVADFKLSAQYFLDRADALLLVTHADNTSGPLWPAAVTRRAMQKPQFPVAPPDFISPLLVRFVQQRLSSLQ